LDATIDDIRSTIFALQHETGRRSLRSDVLGIVSDATEALGFEPQVTLSGPIDTGVLDRLGDDVLATLREALSNVARHARASKVEVVVDVEPDNGTLTVRVVDDGVGISESDTPGRGLDNMAARAQSMGGRVTVIG
uniref:sensor histidine kinase n=1 Tax=Escherichia coli TaxID=562 RepID=UPI00197AEA19